MTFLQWGILIVLGWGFQESALAQCDSGGAPTCTVLLASESRTIDKFGVCRVVTNNNSVKLMVPHNSASEWCGTTSGCTGGSGSASFVQAPPSNVTVDACSGFGAFDMQNAFCTHGWPGSCTATSSTVTLSVSGGPRNMYISEGVNYCITQQYSKNGGAWTSVLGGATVSLSNGDNLRVRSTSADTDCEFEFRDLTVGGPLLDGSLNSHICTGGGCP